MNNDLTTEQQTILPSAIDHHLQPDALRGSEWVFNTLKDGDGNRIEIADQEQVRRDFQARAVESRAPIRVNTSQSIDRNTQPMATDFRPQVTSNVGPIEQTPTEQDTNDPSSANDTSTPVANTPNTVTAPETVNPVTE